jgi:hypothetical protein
LAQAVSILKARGAAAFPVAAQSSQAFDDRIAANVHRLPACKLHNSKLTGTVPPTQTFLPDGARL